MPAHWDTRDCIITRPVSTLRIPRRGGYSTAGSYNPFTWVADHYQPQEVELPDYGVVAADVATKLWPEHYGRFEIPYLPSLSPRLGFDTPHIEPSTDVRPAPNVVNGRHASFSKNENRRLSKALVQASFAYLNQRPDVPRIITIACFNEWSEGHYLLPDNRFGYGMLEALAEALGKEG